MKAAKQLNQMFMLALQQELVVQGLQYDIKDLVQLAAFNIF